jgi:AraC-like DNA-binding protein
MNNSAIHLNIKSYDEEGKKHSHHYHQLVLPLTGTLSLSINDHGGEVNEKKAAIIPAGSEHEYSAWKNNCFLVADIPQTLVPTLEKLPPFVDVHSSLRLYIYFLHQQLLEKTHSNSTQQQMLLLLIKMMQERHHGSALHKDHLHINLSHIDQRVTIAKSFLDEHYHTKVTMAELARIAHLSIRQLSSLFKEQVGVTPHHYLTKIRMQQAQHLLENSDLSIQKISDKVGYSALSIFSDRFNRYVGQPPRHFRRKS